MPGNDITGLLGDPEFQKLDPASQREALARMTGDQPFSELGNRPFSQLSDAETSGVLNAITRPSQNDWNTHAYLLANDPGYAKSSATEQAAYLADHLMRYSSDMPRTLAETPQAPAQPQKSVLAALRDLVSASPETQLAVGAGKGVLNTISGVSSALNKIPGVGEYLAPTAGVNAMRQLSQPDGTGQQIGRTAEQAGEFMVPGLGEDDAALAATKALPWLGKAAPVVGRLALNTAGSAAVNSLQGGSAGVGAAAGLGSGLLGEGIAAAAPKVAETALGVTARMRSPSKTIGQAVLDETSGFTPSAVGQSASQKIASLTGQLNAAASASQNVASLKPAFDVLDTAEQAAKAKNSAPLLAKVNAVRSQLTTDIATGAVIPGPNGEVAPARLLALKRGIGDLVNTWQPQERAGFNSTIKQVYGALDSELDRTVPGAQQINQQISSLIPARTRANILSNSASTTQRVAGRLARPTGALAGAGIGGAFGYERGGTPGAVAGAATGLVLPEMLSSPTAQMMAARGAQNAPSMLPFLSGLALQAARTDPNPQPPRMFPWIGPQ